MRKVIVTGGAGFIGSHTCVELAAAGFEPVLVDDLRNSRERAVEGIAAITGTRPRLHEVDCCDEAAMERVFAAEGNVFGVVHFAAYKAVHESMREPLKYYANNLGSLMVLLRVMERHGVERLVFSSSCTVYGLPQRSPVTEDAPDHTANSPYGSTKVAGERLLRELHASGAGPRSVLLRYFNPVGAHPSGAIGELPIGVPNNLVPYVAQVAAGLREHLTIFGDDYTTVDGTCVRDYIHVVDLARAHVAALDWMDRQATDGCEVFNIGTGSGHSVLEVVRTFMEVNGMDVPYRIGPRRAGDVPSVFADTRKSADVLGWRSTFSLSDALRDTWRWQRALKAQ